MTLARWQATIQDEEGNVLPGALVEVRREVSGAPLAALFSDRDGTAGMGNPFAADVDGFAAFHVAGGAYRITVTHDGDSRVWRYVAIGKAAESDTLTFGITYEFDAATADADPGVGLLRFNNTVLASVTQIYIDDLSSFGVDVSDFLDTFDDGGSSADRGTLVLAAADASGFGVFRVTGAVDDAGGYKRISVTPISTGGAFADEVPVQVFFMRAGIDSTGDVIGPAAGSPGVAAGELVIFSDTSGIRIDTSGITVPDIFDAIDARAEPASYRSIADISGGGTIAATDVNSMVEILAGTGTLAFQAAATLGSRFRVTIKNSGTGNVTLNPDGVELIDGLASWVLYPGGAIEVFCNGSALRSVLLSPMEVTFTTSDTFVKPGVGTWVDVEAWGAGGSGGRGTTDVAGGGGGGGAMVPIRLPMSALSATETVTIGAGGAARTSNQSGQAGGNTTLGSLVTAYGGAGGQIGAGGTGGGGGGAMSAGATSGNGGAPYGDKTTTGGAGFGGGFESGDAYYGGGGGGGGDAATGDAGGDSFYGGGGGGGGGDTTAGGAAGSSVFGGAGGAGATGGSTAGSGTVPGGGGGGSETGNSGAGANGRMRVRVS